jgi:hypothetical protein
MKPLRVSNSTRWATHEQETDRSGPAVVRMIVRPATLASDPNRDLFHKLCVSFLNFGTVSTAEYTRGSWGARSRSRAALGYGVRVPRLTVF